MKKIEVQWAPSRINLKRFADKTQTIERQGQIGNLEKSKKNATHQIRAASIQWQTDFS